MNITKEWLAENKACDAGAKWWQSQNEVDGITVVKKLMTEGEFFWANWLIVRLMTHHQRIKYMVFAAEQVIDNFEKSYPDDKRPRQAIEAAKLVIENDTPENRSAADSAASAADSAAYRAAYRSAKAANKGMQKKIVENGIKIMNTVLQMELADCIELPADCVEVDLPDCGDHAESNRKTANLIAEKRGQVGG